MEEHTMKNIYQIGKHIYITSDEEIKEGDWVIYNNELQKSDGISFKSVDKKIILTTDPDLIADGVQAIDDEFLEWFVKNPSCEYVNFISYSNEKGTKDYELIIPQDEAKQRAKNYMSLKGALEPKQIKCDCGHTTMCDCSPLEEPKQETLEEAALRYNPLKKLDGEFIRQAFKEGAKWQAERMYSEEELKNAIEISVAKALGVISFTINEESFEQFKKK